MPYKILEDEATADIAIAVKSKSLSRVFCDCAIALFDVLADRKTVGKKIKKRIMLSEKDVEDLLYKFLCEIVYFKDANNMVFSDVKVSVKKSKNVFIMNATIFGDEIGSKKQKTKTDVKAITLHMFNLEKTKVGWQAKFVPDI